MTDDPNDPRIPRRRDIDPHLHPLWMWALDHQMVGFICGVAVFAVVLLVILG